MTYSLKKAKTDRRFIRLPGGRLKRVYDNVDFVDTTNKLLNRPGAKKKILEHHKSVMFPETT